MDWAQLAEATWPVPGSHRGHHTLHAPHRIHMARPRPQLSRPKRHDHPLHYKIKHIHMHSPELGFKL